MIEGRFGALRPEILFLSFWVVGVAVPVYPFLEEWDGFSVYWGYFFSDKLAATEIALMIYGMVLALFIVGAWAGRCMAAPLSANNRSLTPSALSLSFPVRMFVVVGFALVSFVLTIVALGGIDNVLAAGSDRIRQYAGLNFLALLQNGLLSASLAWFVRLTGVAANVRRHFWFIVFSAGAVVLVGLQGQKSTIFIYLLACLIVWHVRVRRFRFLELALTGGTLFVAFMIYHVFKQEYLAVGEFVFLDSSDGFLVSSLRFLSLQLTGNFMQLQCMAVLVDAMPRALDFQGGETFKMVALIWLPSALFPDKPLTAPGVFTLALWPEKWENEGTTLPPGLFGEFYMNFGAAGVAIGALLFGLLYGFLYGRAAKRPQSDSTLAVYAVMAGGILHYFRGELASVTLLLVTMIVPLVWILWAPSARSAVVLREAPVAGRA